MFGEISLGENLKGTGCKELNAIIDLPFNPYAYKVIGVFRFGCCGGMEFEPIFLKRKR